MSILLNGFLFFLASLNKCQKKTEKRNKKKKENPYLSPRREQPTQPSRPTRGSRVIFPAPRLEAARWNSTEPAVDATSPPRTFQAPSCLLLAPGDTQKQAASIPPSRASSPPPSSFSSAPE